MSLGRDNQSRRAVKTPSERGELGEALEALRRLLPPEELSLPTEIKAPPPSENASDRLAVGLAELRSRLENRVVTEVAAEQPQGHHLSGGGHQFSLANEQLTPSRPAREARRLWRHVLLALGASIVIAGGVCTWRVSQIVGDFQEHLKSLQLRASGEPSSGQLAASDSSATQSVLEVCAEAGELGQALGPIPDLAGAAAWNAQLIKGLPGMGTEAAGMLALAPAANDAFAGLRLACGAFDPLLQTRGARMGFATVIDQLGAQRPQLKAAVARLGSAETELSRVDEKTLDESTAQLYRGLRDRLPGIVARLSLTEQLPAMLGVDGPRTYLVLGQNSDELRPTGGFVGTSGTVTFEAGRLVRRQYGTSSTLNVPPDLRVTPPEPLQIFMGAGYWHLREANWWPDFPSSAQQSRYFYDITGQEPLSGVIAMDQEFLADLIGATGPVFVDGYGETITRENVRERLEHYVHHASPMANESRKAFVSALFTSLTDQFSNLGAERLSTFTTILDRALNEQHLLIWTQSSDSQRPLANLGWDGHMLTAPADYLFPVSANLGANKVNRDVEQELAYEVEAEPTGRLLGRATIVFRNQHLDSDPSPYATSDYRDYFRLYAPAGAELLSTSGFEVPSSVRQECGKSSFAGLVIVPPGEQRQVEIAYRLPASITEANYSLLVQKQPGAPTFPIRFRWSDSNGEVVAQAATHQRIVLDRGALAATRYSPELEVASAAPACDVSTEPPEPLHPPVAVSVPKLGLQSDTVELGVEPDGTPSAPATGNVIGWYRQSARPGQMGNMIVSGHLDWERRPAIFWRLAELRAGDRIQILAQGGGKYTYDVRWMQRFEATTAPLDEILGPTSESWLTLITCGGDFDNRTHTYRDRVVVRATLDTGR